MKKLFVVVRADLLPGQQAVQAMHAQRAFAAEHAAVERAWFEASNTLALLSVPSRSELESVLTIAKSIGINVASFHDSLAAGEPEQMTAIALEPGAKAAKLCRSLPLALRDVRSVRL